MELSCSIIRGGTSKGIFVQDDDLAKDPAVRKWQILQLFGSPHSRQIDGLGGADPLTSKLALVCPSSRPGINVEYESIEVGISEGTLNNSIMCGNLAAGVGYFAIMEGMVDPVSPETSVVIYSRNNGKTIIASIPSAHGSPDLHGRYTIHGVPGSGPEVRLNFVDPAGAVTGRLLPMDEPLSVITLSDGQRLSYSLVDSGTLYAFFLAEELGITGHETPAELDCNMTFKACAEAARERVVDAFNEKMRDQPHIDSGSGLLNKKDLKIAVLAAPGLQDTEADIVAKVINPFNVHKAFAVSGAICLATATVIPETIAHNFCPSGPSPARVRIRHPSGTMCTTVDFEQKPKEIRISSAEVSRTARILMRGTAFISDPSEYS